jgi:uncharacterized protein
MQGCIVETKAAKKVWAPWYTLHKILAGLIDQYLYCDNQQALDIALKMGSWAYNKLQRVTPAQRTVLLRNEFGGINESFYNLYAISGKKEYKWLAEFFYHNEVLDPLLQGKTKFPVKVTVVAWQYGSVVPPKIQTAQAVERSFYIND